MTSKKYLSVAVVLLTLLGCSSTPKATSPTSLIDASYRELANRFEIINCIFWEGYCSEQDAYRSYWKEHFGFDEHEQNNIALYSDLRTRYDHNRAPVEKDPLKNKSGIFAVGDQGFDPIAEAFYASSDLNEALHRIEDTVSAPDRDTLRTLFLNYAPELDQIAHNSQNFKKLAVELNRTLQTPQFIDFTGYIKYFFRLNETPLFHVLYAWLPPIQRDNGSPTGKYLILEKKPNPTFF